MTNTIDIPTDSPLRSLGETLVQQLATKRDLMADTRRISLAEFNDKPLTDMRLLVDLPDGAEEFGINRHAHQQIGEALDLPWKTYERLLGTHPDLLGGLVNGLFAREPKTRMLRTLDGKVRAFLSDRYRPRDNWDLLEQAVLPALNDFRGSIVRFKEATLTDSKMYLKIVLDEMQLQITPKVGDILRGGVIVQNSEVGSGATRVAPFTDQLICTNGMVHTEYGQSSYHVGRRHTSGDGAEAWDLYSDETLKLDDSAFFAKVADTVRGVLSQEVFEKIVADMRELSEMTVSDVPAAVELIGERHGFTEVEQRMMLDRMFDAGDRSGWGIVNSITATARDLDDADRRVELETLAGSMTADRKWAAPLAA